MTGNFHTPFLLALAGLSTRFNKALGPDIFPAVRVDSVFKSVCLDEDRFFETCCGAGYIDEIV